MTVETIARTIQLILAPVVMVSACAILITGLLNRYSAINDRLRLMARERLDLLADTKTSITHERLGQVDAQIPLLLGRHKLAHDSVLAVYVAIAIFIADMFVIALGAVMYADWIGATVLLLFLLGIGFMMYGVVLTTLEVRTSHQALYYEIMRVAALNENDAKGA
jgi:hypothetical protein